MISIVIPVYNNAKTLMPLTERIDAALQGRDYEILYVNDGSRDSSLSVLREVVERFPRARAISLARNKCGAPVNLTTVNMDFIQHYRPSVNVVSRPTGKGGKGYKLTGHHEIMFPLLMAAAVEERERRRR